MHDRTLALSLISVLTLTALLVVAGNNSRGAQASSAMPQGLAGQMPRDFDQEVARVVAAIDGIEADTLRKMDQTTLDRQGQTHTLGKLLLFDKQLSVNQNEACSFCHTPETGFTGPIQSLNLSTVSYPGSVRTRFS
jgi:cytochrome c peroxidase